MPQGIDPDFRRMLQKAENAALLEKFEDGIVTDATMIFPEDSVEGGSQTIGFGHKVLNPDTGAKLASGGAPFSVIQQQLDHDIENRGVVPARRSFDEKFGSGAFDRMSPTGQMMATAIQFNTRGRFAESFPRMAEALSQGDLETALQEMALDTSEIPGLARRNDMNVEFFTPRIQAELASRQTAGAQ